MIMRFLIFLRDLLDFYFWIKGIFITFAYDFNDIILDDLCSGMDIEIFGIKVFI